jgi:hypothetical protein
MQHTFAEKQKEEMMMMIRIETREKMKTMKKGCF